MAKLTEAQTQTMRRVVQAGDDGYEATPLDARMVTLWEMDLLEYYAPECLWFATAAGRAALASGERHDGLR